LPQEFDYFLQIFGNECAARRNGCGGRSGPRLAQVLSGSVPMTLKYLFTYSIQIFRQD